MPLLMLYRLSYRVTRAAENVSSNKTPTVGCSSNIIFSTPTKLHMPFPAVPSMSLYDVPLKSYSRVYRVSSGYGHLNFSQMALLVFPSRFKWG